MSDLLQECLGEKIDSLPPVIRKAHTGKIRLEGYVVIRRGNILARIIGNILGMPPENDRAYLVVDGDHFHDHMLWKRNFDGFAMHSIFQKDGRYLVEKLGPIQMWLLLDVIDGVMSYNLLKTRFSAIPIPSCLSPKLKAEEWQEQDSYVFRVKVSLPLIGQLVGYSGKLNLMDPV